MSYPSFSYPAPGQRRRSTYPSLDDGIGAGPAPYTASNPMSRGPAPYPTGGARQLDTRFINGSGPYGEGSARPTIGTMPMSPYGGNSSYADSHTAGWMQSLERNRSDQQFEHDTAGIFPAAKNMGMNDDQARRASFIARHGGLSAPMVPQGYGQVGQQGPTYVMQSGGGRSGGNWSGVPFALPPGANVVSSSYPGAGAKPANPVDRSTAYKNYLGHPITDPSTGEPKYAMKPEDALKGADEDMARSGQPGAAAQPSQPAAPTMPQTTEGYPGGTKNRINLSEQHARAMWDVIRQANPNAQPDQLLPAFHKTLAQYGVKGDAAQAMTSAWLQQDQTLTPGQPQQSAQVQQGARVPVSMLGATNGMDPSQRYGAPRQATQGPSIPTQPRLATQTGLPQEQVGYTPVNDQYGQEGPQGAPAQAQAQQGRPLDPQTAAQLLQHAGGDKDRARAAARALGYQF